MRINGRARLVRDADFFGAMEVKGHRPVLALVVEINEVFHHCAKAFLRARLWDPESWDPEGIVPRHAVVTRTLNPAGRSLAQLDEYYGPSYADTIYRG